MKLRHPIAAIVILAFLACGAWVADRAWSDDMGARDLDEARQCLWRHPPNGTNTTERRQWMAVIQKACDRLPAKDYKSYESSWFTNDALADRMEAAAPALSYLRGATAHAMRDIRRTKVTKGLAVWHIYNMGYVFKTPTACFGVDIKGRETEMLADDLDFLLISHEHADHYHKPLIDSMIAKEKPVVTRWFPGTIIPEEDTTLNFADARVKVDIGDHHHEQEGGTNNMLMFEIVCGSPAHDAVIYHSGDGNNYKRMRPSKPVDVFIPHVSVGMSIPRAVNHVDPSLTLVSHVMELGHKRDRWRWSYDHAFDVIKDIPEGKALVLTWGERYLLPGTVLQDGGGQQQMAAEPADPPYGK